MDPFIGQILLVPYTFAPTGWAFCQGQVMPINQFQALFALIGVTYGGNGVTTFNLPDLRGRVPISAGQGTGLQNYNLGQAAGSENLTLTTAQMPTHNHGIQAVDDDPASGSPAGAYPADISSPGGYASSAPTTTMANNMVSMSGGGGSHPNLQPYLTLNYIIALTGIFPSRS